MKLSHDTEFTPVRYRPIAQQTDDLQNSQKLLDGIWRINPRPTEDAVGQSLKDPGWSDFRVPGQWLQQGHDVLPQWPVENSEQVHEPPVAVATEFSIPNEWADHRIFLRFDSIHAGTRYFLNGKELGYSEMLFVPVEWEITDFARPGEENRLDLQMVVTTLSEKFATASWYAKHNLGGIDRSVRIYALPKLHIRDFNINTDLDSEYRNADLNLKFTLDNPLNENFENLSLRFFLTDPQGAEVSLSTGQIKIGSVPPGTKVVESNIHVTNPLKWNAEQPHLYGLAMELRQGGTLLQRIERKTGFRKIEVRGSQLLVNGARVKLAGVCRHEVGPYTGRADTMHLAEEDVRLLKEANINYIRTSHYPPPQELLDAADRFGIYVEAEAPFCWVRSVSPLEQVDLDALNMALPKVSGAVDISDPAQIECILNPTSAMIDYCHTHPSVIIWSLANESVFSKVFEIANDLCKQLDPTRPTTFNWPDPRQICDIANVHYPPMPYDEQKKEDTRPLLLGEFLFPICHEMTEVDINPGLRELWSHGQSTNATNASEYSDFEKECAESFEQPILKPGAKPGAWSHIYHSDRVIGGAIWAAIDEPFFFADGKRLGFAFLSGYWGIIDAWRRRKPEWWYSKLIFSPVWFLAREMPFIEGQKTVRIPLENRYSFTNLNDLTFEWELGGAKGQAKVNLLPACQGVIEIPIPKGTAEGGMIIVRAIDASGTLVGAASIRLGQQSSRVLPEPSDGAVELSEDANKSIIEGKGFSLVFDRSTGNLDAADPKHRAAISNFPMLHVTRYDFGDLSWRLGPNVKRYAELASAQNREVESVAVEKHPKGVEITIHDRYEGFSGLTTWLIDASGMGKVSYDYTYSGEDENIREVGMKLLLKPECDEIKWRRWSEWGDIYPENEISRTEGTARARRPEQWGEERWDKPPAWPWALDQTELGTNDFRSIKFHVYEASLVASNGKGIRVHANADAHVRPAISEEGAKLHILSKCRLGQVVLKAGDRLQGCYRVEIL